MKKLFKITLGLLAFSFGFILGMSWLIIKYSIPVFCMYLIFAFITQDSNPKLWSVETRIIFVLLSAISIYGLFFGKKEEIYII